MFNFGRDSKDIALLALVGLGLYSQCNELNLANNTTILLLAFFLFFEHEEIQGLKGEVCCIEEATDTTFCKCGRLGNGCCGHHGHGNGQPFQGFQNHGHCKCHC